MNENLLLSVNVMMSETGLQDGNHGNQNQLTLNRGVRHPAPESPGRPL